MTLPLTERFKAAVTDRLRPLESSLIPVLRQLVEHRYPPEVASVAFEVFTDAFTQQFPVRAFFLDASNSEHFVYIDGKATYPSPVDPGLLDLHQVFDEGFQDGFLGELDDLDVFTLAGEALIPWFATCWGQAGGAKFPIGATIALHDDPREFDLVRGRWRES